MKRRTFIQTVAGTAAVAAAVGKADAHETVLPQPPAESRQMDSVLWAHEPWCRVIDEDTGAVVPATFSHRSGAADGEWILRWVVENRDKDVLHLRAEMRGRDGTYSAVDYGHAALLRHSTLTVEQVVTVSWV
jgi:hypothetical protein